MKCSCGVTLTARERHLSHHFDGDLSVLEVFTCRVCRNTVSRELKDPIATCACKGCSTARRERYARTRCCLTCVSTVEPGHDHCSACRDNERIREARTVGEEFALARRRHQARNRGAAA